jgi:hypothetical protein
VVSGRGQECQAPDYLYRFRRPAEYVRAIVRARPQASLRVSYACGAFAAAMTSIATPTLIYAAHRRPPGEVPAAEPPAAPLLRRHQGSDTD